VRLLSEDCDFSTWESLATCRDFLRNFSQLHALHACVPFGTESDEAPHDELNHYSVGDVGKFSLAVGEKESFTIIEYLKIPLSIMYVNLFFENLIFVWVSLVLVFVLLVIFLVLLTENRRAGKS
jgi:hypothetical protein